MTRVRSDLAGSSLGDRFVYVLVSRFLGLLLLVWNRMTVEGREHVPATGPFLVTPVHRSIIDTPVVAAAIRRRQRFMGADKYWKSPRFGRLLSALGGFPVTRGTADREALKRCIELLEGQEPLVLFPEGERKSGPIVQPLFDGASYIAVKSGVPILPVAIYGSERAMPKGAKFVWPHKIHVVIGELIPVSTAVGSKQQLAAARQISEQLHTDLQRLLDQARDHVER
jgi:1-acyl-sn-glycerol-3-phosphate acyltransferase